MSVYDFTFDDFEFRRPERVLEWFTNYALPGYYAGPARVERRPMNELNGLVTWDANANEWLIIVDSNLRGRQLARTLLHETGHLVFAHAGKRHNPIANAHHVDEKAVLAANRADPRTPTEEALVRSFADRELRRWEALLSEARRKARRPGEHLGDFYDRLDTLKFLREMFQ